MFFRSRDSGYAKLERICTVSGKVNKLEKLYQRYPHLDVNRVDLHGWSPLHRCCQHGFVDCVRMLCTIGADMMSVCGEDRLLAVHVAALVGCMDVIRVFVEKDERCLIATSLSGYTVLHLACIHGHVDLVRYIAGLPCCSSLSLPKARDFLGNTALVLAVSSGHIDVASVLINCSVDCDINSQDGNGITALHWAVSNEQPRMVKLLVRSRCKIDVKDSRGRVAVDLCTGSVSSAKIRNILGLASNLAADGKYFPEATSAISATSEKESVSAGLTLPSSIDAAVDDDQLSSRKPSKTKSAQNVNFANLYSSYEEVVGSHDGINQITPAQDDIRQVRAPSVPRQSISKFYSPNNVLGRTAGGGRGVGRRPSSVRTEVAVDVVSPGDNSVDRISTDNVGGETNVDPKPAADTSFSDLSPKPNPSLPDAPLSPTRSSAAKVPPPIPLRRASTKKLITSPPQTNTNESQPEAKVAKTAEAVDGSEFSNGSEKAVVTPTSVSAVALSPAVPLPQPAQPSLQITVDEPNSNNQMLGVSPRSRTAPSIPLRKTPSRKAPFAGFFHDSSPSTNISQIATVDPNNQFASANPDPNNPSSLLSPGEVLKVNASLSPQKTPRKAPPAVPRLKSSQVQSPNAALGTVGMSVAPSQKHGAANFFSSAFNDHEEYDFEEAKISFTDTASS